LEDFLAPAPDHQPSAPLVPELMRFGGPASVGGTPCRATAGAGASRINHQPELHGLSSIA
jgi:hypothetical protein